MTAGDWIPDKEWRQTHPRTGPIADNSLLDADAAEREAIRRIPPHDSEAEIACLGACMLDDEVAKKVAQMLAPSDFYSHAHGRIFAAVASLVLEGNPADPLLIKDALAKSRELEDIGGLEYLKMVAGSVATHANGVSYARIVADKAASRSAINIAHDTLRAAYDGQRGMFVIEQAQESLGVLAKSHTGAAVEPMEFLSGSQMSTTRSNVRWIWRGYIAEETTTLIVAQPKAGKSTLIYALLSALEQEATDFCGYSLQPGVTAVVMSEESQPTIREKILRFKLSDRIRFLTREQAFPPRPLRLVVEAAVAECKRIGAKILVVDTLAVWAHLPPDAEKDAGAMQKALEPLLWASSQGLAVVIVHHMRKADGDGGTSVRGSSALLGTVDMLLELRRFGSDGDESSGKRNQRTLTAISRFEETPEQIVVQLDGDRFVSAGSVEVARQNGKSDRVLSWINGRDTWSTTNSIQDALGGRKGETLAALDSLLAAGKIRRIGKGEKGQSFLWGGVGLIPPDPPPANGVATTPGE